MRGSAHAALVWTHRWVGLTLGAILTVVCVSGSALFFQRQFWEWAHGDLTPAEMPETVGSIDRWIENGRAAVPELGPPIAVWAPHVEHNQSRAGMLIFGGRPPGGLGNMGFVAVLVAPSTGRVLGIVDVDRSPAYAPLFLHRDLWTGAVGRIVSGVTALATLVLLVIGVYLWWPPRARLGRKLLGRPWRVTFRKARPLHDWVGIWTLALLTVLVASGFALVQPEWADPIITATVGPSPDAPGTLPACSNPIAVDAAIAQARTIVPGGRVTSLYPIDVARGRWEIVMAAGSSDARHLETHLMANEPCGAVAIEATPATRSAHEAVSLWLSDAHDGAAFGPAGPAIVSLCGLSPLVLFWSGISMWLRSRRARPAVEQAA